MKLYKFLNADGSAIHGKGKWKPPRGPRPGGWMPAIKGELVACENGYHVVSRGGLLEWIGAAAYEVETRGERIRKDRHVLVAREARLLRKLPWDERAQRLFACDCAEHVLHIYEKRHPNDSRVRNCIEIARKVANGELPVSELAAARAAARAAAGAAAWDAARAAALAAARDAAWDAEQKWQLRCLHHYLEI